MAPRDEVKLGPDGELPPGFRVVDMRGVSFREFAAMNGDDKPADDWAPEDVVAWFLDAKPGGGD